MKNKATHNGTCQCCGAVQKLPAGVLAKHGYTTRWGFFEGTCQGSGYQPFEKSTDLIARFIAWAQEKQAGLEVFKAELLTRPAEGTTEAWVNVYRKDNRLGGRYVWMHLPLVCTINTSTSGDGYQWLTIQYQHPDKPGQMQRLDMYGIHSLDPLDFIFAANQKRAQAVDADIQKLVEYIRWQQKRVAEWKEQDLLPV